MALTIDTTTVSTRVDEIGLAFNENTANGIVVGTIRGLAANLNYDWGQEGTIILNGGGRYRLIERTEGTQKVLDIVTVVAPGAADTFNYEGLRQHELKIVGRNPTTNAVIDEGDFFFQMRDVNEAPTNIRLNGATSIEVVEGTTSFGNLTSDDQDDSGFEYLGHGFSFATNGNPDGLFAFAGDEENGFRLVIAQGKTLDYESNTIQVEAGTGRRYYDVIVNVTDDGGIAAGGTPITTTQPFRVYVTNNTGDDNRAPPAPSGTFAIDERSAADTPVATLAARDDDNQTITYTFQTGGTVSADGRFKIVGNQILVNNPAEVTSNSTVSYAVVANDGSGAANATSNGSITITVNNVNQLPHTIRLDGALAVTVNENNANGAVVGTLSATDAETPAANLTYSFATGGNPGNRFVIDNVTKQLKLAPGVVLDYEALPAGQKFYTVTVVVTDANGGTATQNITINVGDLDDTNRAPNTVRLNGGTTVSVAENTAFEGNLTAIDPDSDPMTFQFATNGNPGNMFVIEDGKIRLAEGRVLDFEGTKTFTVTVVASDNKGGVSAPQNFTINVTNVNEGPENVRLDNATTVTVGENSVVIGTLSASDPENNTISYTLSDDADGMFVLVGGQIRVAPGRVLDFESGVTSYTIEVLARDSLGMSTPQVFTINVRDVAENRPPHSITLNGQSSTVSVAEDQSSIGTLSAIDPDGDAIAGYAFATNGNPDNMFVIDNGTKQIRLAPGKTLDFEGTKTYEIWVVASDGNGGTSTPQRFTINVTNVNEGPANLRLNGAVEVTVNENSTVIGTLSAQDPEGDSFTYSLADSANGLFVINSAGQIVVAPGKVLDYESGASYTIRVVATDSGDRSTSQIIRINVTDIDETPGNNNPSDITLSKNDINENSPVGSTIGILAATDPDASNTGFTFRIVNDPDRKFQIANGVELQLRPGASLDFETKASHDVTIEVTDSAGGKRTETFTISVNNLPETVPNSVPTGVNLSSDRVTELLAGIDFTFATLAAVDSDQTAGFTYSLVDSAGGRFKIDGNSLKVVNGVMLDREQAASHKVVIQVDDGRGGVRAFEKIINVDDLAPEKMTAANASPLNDVIKGSKTGNFMDVFYGGAGDDKLWGGYGNDTLWGGAGKDVFVFDGKLGTSSTDRRVNFDTIKDYSVKDDSIWLEGDLFKGNKALYAKIKKGTELAPKKLESKFFTVGDKAKDRDDYFVYDAKKRVLYYDADGSGSKAAIDLAQFTNNKALKNFKFSELFFI